MLKISKFVNLIVEYLLGVSMVEDASDFPWLLLSLSLPLPNDQNLPTKLSTILVPNSKVLQTRGTLASVKGLMGRKI